MIREILDELGRGSTTVAKLSRKLKVEKGALEGMLQYMVRRGLVRELHPQCHPKGCRGCRYQGMCHLMPVTGYELVQGASEAPRDGKAP